MKKLRVGIKKYYFDTVLQRNVNKDEELIMDYERGKEVIESKENVAFLIETIEDEPIPVEEPKPAPKKRATRKKKK